MTATASMMLRSRCAVVNRLQAPARCPTANCRMAPRSRPSCPCPARPCRRCRPRSLSWLSTAANTVYWVAVLAPTVFLTPARRWLTVLWRWDRTVSPALKMMLSPASRSGSPATSAAIPTATNPCPQGTVGQRAPTPPLDMLTEAGATANGYNPAQAGGWDGGLPRHGLLGYVSGGLSLDTQNRLDFRKMIELAQPVYFPEIGTDLEKVSMAFHAVRERPSAANNLADFGTTDASFGMNGAPPVPGGPFQDPCIDDQGALLNAGVVGDWFDGDGDPTTFNTRGAFGLQWRKPAYLQDRQRADRRGVQQGRLPLSAGAHHRPVGGRGTDHQQAAPAGTPGDALQHLRLRQDPAHQPGAGRVRARRLPGAHADRHHRPAHPPAEVGPDHG